MATLQSAEGVSLGQRLATLIDQIVGLADEVSSWRPQVAQMAPVAVVGGHVSGHGDGAELAPEAAVDLAQLARRRYSERRRRAKHFPESLFGEPAWDMLLDLYIAAEAGMDIPVTSACIAADVPATTALRWLQVLEAHGLVERRADPRDARRSLVKLTSDGYVRMATYLTSDPRLTRRPQAPIVLAS